MKKAPTIEAAVSATNSAQETSTNMSSNVCETWPPSNDERAAVNERFATLLKRCMKRESEFGDGEAFDAVTRPSLLTVNRPGLMDAEAAAKTEEQKSLPAAAGGFARSATGSYAAAGASAPMEDQRGLGNSDEGENRIITPRPLADRA